MNASAPSRLDDLYRTYLSCVDVNLTAFLAAKPAATAGYAPEWCTKEKHAYFDFMQTHFKTEYDNIIRLEGQNY